MRQGTGTLIWTAVCLLACATDATTDVAVGGPESMKRNLVSPAELRSAGTAEGRAGAAPGDFGEDDETECASGQPIRMGDVTWTGEEFQTMEGIGYSLVFYTSWLAGHKPAVKKDMYDAIFGELQPSILRMRNSWDSPNQWQDVNNIMSVDEELFREAKARLGKRVPKVMLTSWSPPARLKESGVLGGAGNSVLVKGNKTNQFVYDELARFWVDGLAAYAARGIAPKFIAMNEGDYQAAFDSSRMDASESYAAPGLFKAIDVIYDALHANMSTPPAIVGPETAVWDSHYLDHWSIGNPRIHAVSGHLYSAGDTFDSPGFFDRLRVLLANVQRKTKARQVRQVFMTEYASLKVHRDRDPLLLARTIYETLTRVDAGMYLHWDGMWATGTGEGSLFLVDNPWSAPATWQNAKGYAKTASFSWFQHFSRFIRPGMTRFGCTVSDTVGNSVKALCFSSASGESSVIMINFSTKMSLVKLRNLPGTRPRSLFQSTLAGTFKNATASLPPIEDNVWLPPESISTLYGGAM